MFNIKSFSKINSLDQLDEYSIVIETPILDKNITNIINNLASKCICTKFYVIISEDKNIKVYKKYNNNIYYYNGILSISDNNIYNFIHNNCLCSLNIKK